VTIRLDIPAAPEVLPRLRTELAVTLYAQEILSFGKASELADLNRFFFADLVTKRDIPRHYTKEELSQDLDYARQAHADKLPVEAVEEAANRYILKKEF
jgi:predicted HTH domain antitoxin